MIGGLTALAILQKCMRRVFKMVTCLLGRVEWHAAARAQRWRSRRYLDILR